MACMLYGAYTVVQAVLARLNLQAVFDCIRQGPFPAYIIHRQPCQMLYVHVGWKVAKI